MLERLAYKDLLKKAKELEDSEKKYRRLFESAMVGMYRTRLEDGKFLAANRSLAKMMGYDSVHTFMEDYVTSEHYADPNRREQLIKQLEKEGKVDDFEIEMIRTDGSHIYIAISATIYPMRGYSEGVIIDITERKLAEKALKLSQETFLTVLDSIDATVYVSDMDTHEILFANKNMIESFGEDMTGKICFEAFRKESRPCSHCTNGQLIDKDSNPTGLIIWQGKNPITQKWYINYDRAIEWIDGRIVKLQIATDITNLKTMEQQLQQTQKFEAIGTLAGGIAHNFNNLMMGMQGRLSLMVMDVEQTHPLMKHIKAVENHIQSATNLTRQLLGLARGGKYEVKPIDINLLIQRSTDLFGQTRKEIKIHTNLHTSRPVVEADENQIEQVLLNLFVNSWQAMPNGGDLNVDSEQVILDENFTKHYNAKPGRYAKISINDDGVGMDEETRQKAFDPFFTTKEKGRGTGLGLASAYGIIKNHDAIITIDSKIGVGTTFSIFLPLSDKTVQTAAPILGPLISGTETILLVDDEQMILEVGKEMLEKLGYRVLVASGGEKALGVLQECNEKIDLAIIDLIMPGMEGGRLFDYIKGSFPDMPVILSSGYAIDGKAEQIMRKGCNGFMQKPFNISKLSIKVRHVLNAVKNS